MPKITSLFLLNFFVFLSVTTLVPNRAKSATQYPIPRFVTLRSNTIVMRAGPGREYPIIWRLQKQGLPVKIIAEFDMWRHVECHDGTKGWIHKSLLSGRRNLFIVDGPKTLFKSKSPESRPIAKLNSGILVATKIKKCSQGRCPVKVADFEGWVNKADVWGLLSTE